LKTGITKEQNVVVEMLNEGKSKRTLKRPQSPDSHERENEYRRQWYHQNKDVINACRRDAYQKKKRTSINR